MSKRKSIYLTDMELSFVLILLETARANDSDVDFLELHNKLIVEVSNRLDIEPNNDILLSAAEVVLN